MKAKSLVLLALLFAPVAISARTSVKQDMPPLPLLGTGEGDWISPRDEHGLTTAVWYGRDGLPTYAMEAELTLFYPFGSTWAGGLYGELYDYEQYLLRERPTPRASITGIWHADQFGEGWFEGAITSPQGHAQPCVMGSFEGHIVFDTPMELAQPNSGAFGWTMAATQATALHAPAARRAIQAGTPDDFVPDKDLPASSGRGARAYSRATGEIIADLGDVHSTGLFPRPPGDGFMKLRWMIFGCN